MNNCIPCPPCEGDESLVCEPYGTVTTGNRVMVEDDAFCTKTLASPSSKARLTWDGGVKWIEIADGWKAITTAYNAAAEDKLSVNSSSGPVLITLPSAPSQFEEIIFADHFNSWGINNVTIQRNGSFIENVAQDLILDTTWPIQFTLRYQGSTWRVFEA
jgi:hypothetical protein